MGGNAPARRVGALLAAVVLTSVVVFSLGVMVGKRVTGTVPLIAEPPAALPTETLVPPPALEKPSGEKKDPPAVKERSSKPISSEKLTFFDTLSADKPAPPTLPKEPPAKVKTSPRPAPPPPAEVKVSAKPPPARPSPRELSQVIAGLMGPGNYYVQVSSTTNRAWADDLVGKLKKKGIPSKSTSVTLKGKKWFRIRVGTFADKGSARKAASALKEKMKLDSMVVTGD